MLARLGTSSGDLSMAWVFKPGVAVRQVQSIWNGIVRPINAVMIQTWVRLFAVSFRQKMLTSVLWWACLSRNMSDLVVTVRIISFNKEICLSSPLKRVRSCSFFICFFNPQYVLWEPSIFVSMCSLHEKISRMQKLSTIPFKLPVIIIWGLKELLL